MLGAMKVIKPLQSDPRNLAPLLAKKCPKISPLWLATIWNGQSSRVLKSAWGGLPPISLPAASWTDTIQSFLQASYLPITDRRDAIPRAREYSVAYLVRPDIIIPFTPSPPFGETAPSNLSLEVKEHLEHNHRPILHRTSWVLETGEELPDQKGLKRIPQPNYLRLPPIARTEYMEGFLPNELYAEADTISCDACFNLFNWHRNNEGGLWLAEGFETADAVRRKNSHAWIMNDSDDDDMLDSGGSENTAHEDNNINRWQDGVA
ncbi:MAG: hypothetical protein Q9196_006423 [Gyalolechia fulgens]